MAGIATHLVGAYGPRAVPGVPISALTRNIVRIIVVAGGLLVVLNELGIEIRPMLAALGVGGLAVALALQEPLANLFAGLFVSLAGQVRIGDHVKLDSGVEGRIVDFNWRSTWLEVPGGSVAVVPNSKLSQSIVTNFNLPNPELAIPVDFTVRYEEDTGTGRARGARSGRRGDARHARHGEEVRAGDALSHLHRPWLARHGDGARRHLERPGADSPPSGDGAARPVPGRGDRARLDGAAESEA